MATKPGFIFLCSFYVVVMATKPGFSFFILMLCCCKFCYGCMFAFVVFDLFSSVLSQGIGWEERLRNDLYILCRLRRKTLKLNQWVYCRILMRRPVFTMEYYNVSSVCVDGRLVDVQYSNWVNVHPPHTSASCVIVTQHNEWNALNCYQYPQKYVCQSQ